MPMYEYQCPEHGIFSVVVSQYSPNSKAMCPECEQMRDRIISRPAKAFVHYAENQMLGNKSKGKYIPASETGGLPVLIPSFGALEKEEVEYTALVATEREKERVRKKKALSHRDPEKAKALENIVNTARNAPQGKRQETLSKVIKEGMV